MVTPMDIGPDSDLIASITPDVMTCFRRSHFFERLDVVVALSLAGLVWLLHG